ncbi:Miniconductance mechanosensitive channel YbdG [Olavius algarvensis associated proteobacterium Delta 3]|nr:Miniconductance mechanosensitive channel YbdG [Olavius algarvensis associated proteobacterium Delta 3]CAB5146804.1 Miniconductance mechanosensitive channel YbdG [Olavius algarvensis associated proteobacterium Delta 3]
MNLPEMIESWLLALNLGAEISSLLAKIILAVAVLMISVIALLISRRVVRMAVHRVIRSTRFTWDNKLVESRLFMRMTLIVPALIIYLFVPAIFGGYDQAIAVVTGALNVYFVIVAIMVADALIDALYNIYRGMRVSQAMPMRSFAQVLKIIVYFTGVIMAIAVILDRSPIILLSGLGAISAVLMLVFKDSILGFAAGVQLSSNRMLRNGDWIEMSKYGADGDVVDISLTTVKVRNWDHTITTIPTYALMSDSFKNWRGMQESMGRRIKRAIYIDMNSIKFCTPQMLERFAHIRCIADYVERKNREIEAHNAELGDDAEDAANIRQLTNIGTFRAYALAYLKNHPDINQALTLMVRQLAPTEHGLPLEIYAFCKDKRWVYYEGVQSDIFDHLLAIASEFDLKIFQFPAGTDIQKLSV